MPLKTHIHIGTYIQNTIVISEKETSNSFFIDVNQISIVSNGKAKVNE